MSEDHGITSWSRYRYLGPAVFKVLVGRLFYSSAAAVP